MLDEAPPPAGHNRPPPVDPDLLGAFRERIERAAETAGSWLDAKVIESDEDASRARDYIRAIKALKDEIDAARQDAKRPHDEAAKAVQEAFRPLLTPLIFTDGAVKSMLSRFAERKRAALEEDRDARLAALRAELAEAEQAAEAARGRNDVLGIAGAEDRAGDLRKQIKALAGKAGAPKVQIGSATGGARTMGQRTVRRATLVNVNHAFMHYRDHPALRECLESLANADLRAAKGAAVDLPGFIITEERIVA